MIFKKIVFTNFVKKVANLVIYVFFQKNSDDEKCLQKADKKANFEFLRLHD